MRRKGISVLVAESNDFLREKIAGRVSRNKSVRVVSQISDFANIVQTVMECAPDLVISDVRQMVMHSGVMAELKAVCPKTKVYLMADSSTGQYAEAAKEMGSDGIIEKFMADSDLQSMIEAAMDTLHVNEDQVQPDVLAHEDAAGKRVFKVLAADDDAFFRHRLESVLDKAGIPHCIVASGAAVLKRIIDSPAEFSCMMLDVHMGGMSGISVARIVRHYYKNMPVVLMTSDDSPNVKAEAAEIEGAVLLTKPYKEQQIIELITRISGSGGKPRGKRVLVVEDDDDIREFLKEIIISNGHICCEAADGASALARFIDFEPHMLMIDIILPDMKGWDVVEMVSETAGKDLEIPIMFFSGNPSEEDAFYTKPRQKTFFLAKPFDIDTIENIIDTMFCANCDTVDIFANRAAI